ncbi:MAG: exonuclease SbcCD subunit D [Saprospiraceae bacterium]|nr:exonuclease SbcCD subunit D [Saprospiraceae bacterium]
MKVLHFSDTHLGYQAFDRVSAEGINAREQDVYDAFERVVERLLALKPDVVIHSGDFFHRPSPSNRALTFGLEQLRRICDAAIPVVIIAGNHETPKTIYNSPILRALRSLDCIYPIFGEKWEYFEFDGVVVHGVPHINDSRILYEQLGRMRPVEGKFNILMLHTSLGKRFLMEEYGEQVFPDEFEAKLDGFQYVALGHWHNFQKIGLHSNAWYSGSTERLSDTEVGTEKGFIVLDIEPDGSASKAVFEAIPTRSWLRWEMNECHACSVAEIEASLEKFISEHDTRNAIVTLLFNDIRPEQTLELGNLRLRQIFPDAFQLIPRRKTHSDTSFVRGIEASQFDRLDKIFADYLRSKYPDDDVTAKKLEERAAHYFRQHID